MRCWRLTTPGERIPRRLDTRLVWWNWAGTFWIIACVQPRGFARLCKSSEQKAATARPRHHAAP